MSDANTESPSREPCKWSKNDSHPCAWTQRFSLADDGACVYCGLRRATIKTLMGGEPASEEVNDE